MEASFTRQRAIFTTNSQAIYDDTRLYARRVLSTMLEEWETTGEGLKSIRAREFRKAALVA